MGGWAGALTVLSLSRLSPAPVSGNSILETCSGVLVPYTRQIGCGPQQRPGWWPGASGSSKSGPCHGAAWGWSAQRVRTATG